MSSSRVNQKKANNDTTAAIRSVLAAPYIQQYAYWGYLLEVKQQIADMAVNGSGIRDTARVLRISPTTVIETLKKSPKLKAVNEARLAQLETTQTIAHLCLLEDTEAELDQMWSFVGSKQPQRWLWHAVDHETGEGLAYVLAEHKDAAFRDLKVLLEPFGITQFYTDGWGAYERHLEPVFHTVGKANTQTIERKHLTLRTRMKRLAHKTICFSKSEWLHDVVIGLFINRFAFGLTV